MSMSARRAVAAFALICAMGLVAFGGEPAAPAAEEAGDIFDELKHVEAGNIQFKFSGEARFRYQFWHDFNLTQYQQRNARGGKTDGFVESRIRLGVEAAITEQLVIFIEGQDARTWDYDGPRLRGLPDHATYHPFADHLDLRQAWVLYKMDAGPVPIQFKIGRQEVHLGDGRMQSANWWHNTPSVFDAFVVIMPLEPVTIVTWAGKAVVTPDTRGYNHVASNFDYYGIYTMWNTESIEPLDQFHLYGLHLRDDRNPVPYATVVQRGEVPFVDYGDIHLYALGVLAKGHVNTENLKWEIEHVIEFGDYADRAIQSWAFHGQVSYTFPDIAWTPTLIAEYNTATGDRSSSDHKFETFLPFFPEVHGHYGLMDLFAWSNMHQWRLACRVQPTERLTIEVAGSHFRVDHDEDNWYASRSATINNHPPNTAADDEVGQELDLLINYEVNERTKVEVGYGHFFAGPFVSDTGPNGGADFFYAMTTFGF